MSSVIPYVIVVVELKGIRPGEFTLTITRKSFFFDSNDTSSFVGIYWEKAKEVCSNIKTANAKCLFFMLFEVWRLSNYKIVNIGRYVYRSCKFALFIIFYDITHAFINIQVISAVLLDVALYINCKQSELPPHLPFFAYSRRYKAFEELCIKSNPTSVVLDLTVNPDSDGFIPIAACPLSSIINCALTT